MEHDEMTRHLRQAVYHLRQVLEAAPKQSNLRDDLSSLHEQTEDLHNAVEAGEYNDIGMAV